MKSHTAEPTAMAYKTYAAKLLSVSEFATIRQNISPLHAASTYALNEEFYVCKEKGSWKKM